MIVSPLNSRPFSFDTEFGDDGGVTPGAVFKPTKRAYLPAEVEALVAQARLEGRETALAEVESLQAMALVTLGQAVAAAAPSLGAVAQAHREQSAELALAAAKVIAAAALDRFPEGPLQAALEALGSEIDATPRLVIRARGLDEAVQEKIQALCVDAGFSGLVVVPRRAGHGRRGLPAGMGRRPRRLRSCRGRRPYGRGPHRRPRRRGRTR
jgi:flagellar assembly protein FliH